MSVYGPRFELPDIQLPDMGVDPKIIVAVIGVIILLAIIVFALPNVLASLDPSITLEWKNNPLDLKSNAATPAELTITLKNTTKELHDLNFTIETNSSEVLIFCPYNKFENVEPGNSRTTTCVVRRNPESVIFSGTYNLSVVSTLGTAHTTLEVVTK